MMDLKGIAAPLYGSLLVAGPTAIYSGKKGWALYSFCLVVVLLGIAIFKD